MPRSDAPGAFARLCGWVDDPDRHVLAASLPTLAQAGPRLKADPKKTVLLYKCWTDVFADYPDYKTQEIGDCVGVAHGRAHDLLQTIDVFLDGRDIDAVRRTSTEFIYGASRQVAGLLGNRDGSYGSAAVRAMTQLGMIPYQSVGGPYDGARAKAWGRTGPPPHHVAEAAGWRLGAGVLLHSAEEMTAALQDGHPCTISSARGWTMERDEQGFCRVSGRWGHCMFVAAYRADIPGYCICQSWGPEVPSGPLALGQPSWSYWCHAEDMERVIAEGDSYALSDSAVFAPRSMPRTWSRA